MKHFITTILFFLSLNASAQHIDKETFVTEIYKNFVDTAFPYYQLSNEVFFINKRALDKLRFLIPETSIQEINKNYETDTIKKTWDYRKLLNAKEVEKDSIGIITGTTIRTFTLKSWSKRRKQKETKKQLEQLYHTREKMPEYDKRVYAFSNPVFDNKKEYAIIHLSFSCGMTCATGCDFIFKLIDRKWHLIGKGECISA